MILPTLLFVLSCTLLEVQGRAFYCDYDARPGPCFGNFKRFFFNKTSSKCESFTYGGCSGNLNRFRSLEDCETDCHEGYQPEYCNLPAETGPCKATLRRYYYNNNTDTCQEFVYGGCGGNGNKFRRLEDCQHECQRGSAAATSKEVCSRPPHSGPCLAYIPRYHYDAASRTCKSFIYGGCQSNGNNFATEEECLSSCNELSAPAGKEVCTRPAHTGPCKAYIPRYHYDHASRTCKRFIYGGCESNGNNFATEEECLSSCNELSAPAGKEVCTRPAHTGPCKAYFRRFYFDTASGTCKKFVYGGCESNGNNFVTEKECLGTCNELSAPTGKEVCTRPAHTGPCQAYFPRFYFDTASGTCKKFVYGGCQSNGNNFVTEKECLGTCSGVSTAPRADLCAMPPETGLCRGYFPRFHFDAASNTCKRFVYGGCGGNENNFKTESACRNACGALALNSDIDDTPICKRPPKTGDCRANIPRFYFDFVTKTCKEFVYGGCDSNGNNFHNQEECMNTCEDEIPVCQRPAKSGKCRGNFPMFYYDHKSGSCKQFVYGGCDSNGNNFSSVEECLKTCEGPIWS